MIEKLNGHILKALQGLKVKALGIAEPIMVTDAEANRVMPAIVSAEGECSEVFDDRYEVGLYHKINRKTYTNSTRGGYGDSKQVVEVYDMSVVVYGFREAISALEAEKRIRKAISRDVNVDVSEFNRMTIFGSEFSGVQFFVQPSVFIIRIHYKYQHTLSACE